MISQKVRERLSNPDGEEKKRKSVRWAHLEHYLPTHTTSPSINNKQRYKQVMLLLAQQAGIMQIGGGGWVDSFTCHLEVHRKDSHRVSIRRSFFV